MSVIVRMLELAYVGVYQEVEVVKELKNYNIFCNLTALLLKMSEEMDVKLQIGYLYVDDYY